MWWLRFGHHAVAKFTAKSFFATPPIYLHLIFDILKFEISSLINLIYCLCSLQKSSSNQKKKSSSSNLIFPTGECQKSSADRQGDYLWTGIAKGFIMIFARFQPHLMQKIMKVLQKEKVAWLSDEVEIWASCSSKIYGQILLRYLWTGSTAEHQKV